jgi:ATP-dependent DNA helicase RecG
MYSIQQLIEKLGQFRRSPTETEWLEFKEAKNNFDSEDMGKYFSALSNEANLKGIHSAWLVFGVKDKPPRAIVGTNYRNDPVKLNALKHEISQHTNGLSFQEIYELNLQEGRVLIFQIPAAPAGMPTSWKGHYYGRNGESIGALSIHELETIRQQIQGIDWSAQICPDATVADLDLEALRVAREKFRKKYSVNRVTEEIERCDLITFLDKAKLTKNGHITRTALLLLGKSESSHYLNPHPAQISWKLETEESAYAHFGPPFLLSVEDVFTKYW